MTRTAGANLGRLLERCPTRSMQRRLVRCVPQLDFNKNDPPTFLYTAGRPNRCNPRGVSCLYFSETEATADLEYRHHWRGTLAEHQPKLTFFARVKLSRIIDLKDREVMRLLGISQDDFEANWRFALGPTILQRVGEAIDSQQEISALRFPSAAARQQHKAGWNVARGTTAAIVLPRRVLRTRN